jgi:hypothetical protein
VLPSRSKGREFGGNVLGQVLVSEVRTRMVGGGTPDSLAQSRIRAEFVKGRGKFCSRFSQD